MNNGMRHITRVCVATVLLLLAVCGCATVPPPYDDVHDSPLFPQKGVHAHWGESLVQDAAAFRIVPEGNAGKKARDAIYGTSLSFSWLHNGLLFYREAFPNGDNGQIIAAQYGIFCVHTEFLYCGRNGQLLVVRTRDNFSAMMREELENAESTMSFLKLQFPATFNLMLGYSKAKVIDQDLLKYRASLPAQAWDEVSEAERDRSSKILKKYVHAEPTIKDGQWQSVFYVLVRDGGVEKWEVSGRVQPFSVDDLKKTVVAKEGTVIRPMVPGD